MVMIQSIQTVACPICGNSIVVTESLEVDYDSDRVRRHCNGTRWERRRFACGYEVFYEPNYNKERKTHDCLKDPVVIQQKQQREKGLDDLKNYIDNLECDQSYKDTLKNRLPL